MPLFLRDFFWSENFAYTGVYLWNVFFHSFCEQSCDKDVFQFCSNSLTPFCSGALSKCQHLDPKAIQECWVERIPLYNLASHLPLPTSIKWGKYLLSCITPRVWIGSLGLQHQPEKWKAVREVRCLQQILKSLLPEKAYMVVAYAEGEILKDSKN